MTINEFKSSIIDSSPPEGINNLLLALWFDAKGDWNYAHETVQEINDSNGAWIHAYLHRKGGDNSNALYWYSRADKEFAEISLDEEWDEIADYMLNVK